MARRSKFEEQWTREQLLSEVRELRASNVRLERRLAELEAAQKDNCLSDASRRDNRFELA